MKRIRLRFEETGNSVSAQLLEDLAPATSQAIWDLLSTPLQVTARHAMYTGRELSMPLPLSACTGTGLEGIAPENLTCFPQAGDLLYTYLPAYAWSGVSAPIFDLGCFYGRDARTFFPAGWLPGNRFAAVRPEDLSVLAELGARALSHGQQTVQIERM